MSKQSLEGKLRAIQELKSQKYVGTQEAWHYIDRVAALYENPIKIANTINEELEKHGQVYFKATSERIMGLAKFYEQVIGEFSDIDEKNLPSAFYDNLFKFADLIFGRKENRNQEELANYLVPIYKDLQKPETTNRDYCIFAIEYTLDKFVIDENVKLEILLNISSVNFDYEFSRENLRDVERECKELIFNNEINIINRVDRMYRDQIDHRLENRREILCDYIDRLVNIYKENQLSYDNFREIIIGHLEIRRKELEEQKRLNMPILHINIQEKMIKEMEFLHTAIAPERNFINKYLRG